MKGKKASRQPKCLILELKRNFDAEKIELKKSIIMKSRAKIGNSCEERETVESPAGEYEYGYHIKDPKVE